MQIHTNIDALSGLKRGGCSGSGLRSYVVHAAGAWQAEDADDVVRLAGDDDAVTFAGPLELTVAVEAANVFEPVQTAKAASGKDCGCQHTELWSYEVSVPAGHTWSYDLKELSPYRVGANRGCRVVIRPRRPRMPTPTQASGDLPCNYAVENLADTGRFFPSACEPCGDRPVRPPTPECGPRLEVPIARGGCVRPRYFNGMAIAREDLETELRYMRLKLRLHNRAAGNGVVWGFDVALRGSRVVVGPGYGVDCCGNDLTVTCDYAVPTEVLLRDPAVCRDIQRGRDCFALLLEYVECPEEPRPVHGNGCKPQAVSCEYSRVRESVRLRLVPPRELPETPLERLFAVVQGKAAAIAVGTRPGQAYGDAVMAGDAATAAAAPTWEPAPAGTVVPWQLRIANPQGNRLLRPSTAGPVSALLPVEKPGGEPLELAAVLDGGTQALGGTMALGTANAPFTGAEPKVSVATLAVPPPGGNVSWETQGAQHLRGGVSVQLAYETAPDLVGVVRDTTTNGTVYMEFPNGQPAVGDVLLARNAQNNTVGQVTVTTLNGTSVVGTASANSQVRPQMTVVRPGVTSLRITVAASRVQIAAQRTGLPCCAGSCCGPAKGLPLADNLRLLLVALLYGKLLQVIAARGGAASGGTVPSDPMVLVLLAILRSQLGVETSRLGEVEDAIHDLYRAWCAAGVYDGPVCRDQPDGVVIGCARICAGDICSVDPLSGRRWVVHQPLIDHWGAQFGIAPLDVTMNGVFAKLCCLSHLPGFGDLVRRPPGQTPGTTVPGSAPSATPAPAPAYAEGAAMAMLRSQPKAATSSFLGAGAADERGAALALKAGGAGSENAFMLLLALIPTLDLGRVAGLIDLIFCGSDDTVAEREAAGARDRRVATLVEGSMNRMAVRRQPRPLMRTASGDLARAVVSLVPASAVVAEDSPLRPALAEAKVATVADLAGREAEDLQRIAGDAPADAVNEAAARAEELVEIAANAVGEATRALGTQGLSSPRDLDKPEMAERLAKEIQSRLAKRKVAVDAAALAKAVLGLKR